MKSAWVFVQYNVSNSIVFITWGVTCRKFIREDELEADGHAIKYTEY